MDDSEAKTALDWRERTEPIIEDILTGWELGYYSVSTSGGFADIIEQVGERLLKSFGDKQSRVICPYSLAVGHVLGQIVERKIQRESS